MAQKYILLKTNDSSDGMIAINKSVFYSIAELSIDEVEDAVRIPKTKFNKPLKVTIADNKLGISADVKVKYMANVNETCRTIQSKIYDNVLQMTGFSADTVTVNVVGFTSSLSKV